MSEQTNDTVRLGFTGVGGRGGGLLERCLEMDDVAVPAICDAQQRHREWASETVTESGRPAPDLYEDHEALVARDDVDGVVIATPWSLHVPMAITAMEAGTTPAIEVGPASSVQECWNLVETAEETGVHCMFLENCCYHRDVMAVLQMVRAGVFGELVHCEGGYCHDLRRLIADPGDSGIDRDGLNYRGVQNQKRNGDLYPTHGLGPVAKALEVNHGNRFVSLTATASKSRGLHDWAAENLPEGHPNRDVDWAIGDVVTTTLECANGETVVLTHDVSLPRPYSLRTVVQGTDGIYQRETDAVHLEGLSPDHEWEDVAAYRDEYEHPMWESYVEAGVKEGHGGIDYLVLRDYVQALQAGARPPIDEYDAATWMAVAPLSEQSIAHGGEPVAVPDFTNGRWLHDDPIFGFTETV
jgi:predicted dehydrogenase